MKSLIAILIALLPWAATSSAETAAETVLLGRVSPERSAHAARHPRGKSVDQEFILQDGTRTVVYSTARIPCPDGARLKGQWFEFTVAPERRDGKIVTKTEAPLTEKHFDVSRWDCLPSSH